MVIITPLKAPQVLILLHFTHFNLHLVVYICLLHIYYQDGLVFVLYAIHDR
jgi:hypothetical protein